MKLLAGTYGGKLGTSLVQCLGIGGTLANSRAGETWGLFCILIWEKNDSWSLFLSKGA